MKLDFNETNILARVLYELDKNPKAVINKVKLIEALHAVLYYTDRSHLVLLFAGKTLITKIEKISDNDVQQIIADNRENKILGSVCYELPTQTKG